MPTGTTEVAQEPDDEHTVMVDRSAGEEPDDEHTVMVDRAAGEEPVAEEPDDEHTVMVDRKAAAKPRVKAATKGKADAAADADADEDGHTVVVNRGTAAASDADDNGEDRTIVVGRKQGKASLARTPASGRRRGIAQPPVPEGFAPRAVDAIGPNSEIVYTPRAIPDLPAAPPEVVEGPAATRAAAPFMPSVLRRGQRTARITVMVFVATCIVSVAGLTLIALAVF